jgi:DNA-binding ferritin-like protein (Dps family)
MTAEEMIQVNNERRKQLNEENRKYYENMLVYLRLSSIPEKKTEELLLEMLDHLLIAQEEGRSAEDVFGKNPESYCKEVVQTMGKRSYFRFSRFCLHLWDRLVYCLFHRRHFPIDHLSFVKPIYRSASGKRVFC